MTIRQLWVAVAIVGLVIYAGLVVADWVRSEVCIGTAITLDAAAFTESEDGGCSRTVDLNQR